MICDKCRTAVKLGGWAALVSHCKALLSQFSHKGPCVAAVVVAINSLLCIFFAHEHHFPHCLLYFSQEGMEEYIGCSALLFSSASPSSAPSEQKLLQVCLWQKTIKKFQLWRYPWQHLFPSLFRSMWDAHMDTSHLYNKGESRVEVPCISSCSMPPPTVWWNFHIKLCCVLCWGASGSLSIELQQPPPLPGLQLKGESIG